jgi:hypothetical protein
MSTLWCDSFAPIVWNNAYTLCHAGAHLSKQFSKQFPAALRRVIAWCEKPDQTLLPRAVSSSPFVDSLTVPSGDSTLQRYNLQLKSTTATFGTVCKKSFSVLDLNWCRYCPVVAKADCPAATVPAAVQPRDSKHYNATTCSSNQPLQYLVTYNRGHSVSLI